MTEEQKTVKNQRDLTSGKIESFLKYLERMFDSHRRKKTGNVILPKNAQEAIINDLKKMI